MKIKILILLLMLSAGACTIPPHSSGNQDTQQWQQTIQQLNTLLKKRKHQAAIDEAKQKISELLAVADYTEPKDTVVKYAQQMINLVYFSYLEQTIPSRHRISGQPQQRSLSATALQTRIVIHPGRFAPNVRRQRGSHPAGRRILTIT